MPTEALTIGPVHTLTQNQVYAMPGVACYIISDTALEASNDVGFASNEAIAADSSVVSAAAFVRCTTGAALVRLVTMS